MKNKLLLTLRSPAVRLLLVMLLLFLSLPGSSSAMQSDAYRLDWLVPMTGSGGATRSPNYSLNLTVGQTVIGPARSSSYAANLGYWQVADFQIYLPAITR